MTEAKFDVEAALVAMKNITREKSQFSKNLIRIFELAEDELSLAQVRAAYNAATGEDKPLKAFADRCWLLWQRDLLTRVDKGVYALRLAKKGEECDDVE